MTNEIKEILRDMIINNTSAIKYMLKEDKVSYDRNITINFNTEQNMFFRYLFWICTTDNKYIEPLKVALEEIEKCQK